MRTVERIPRRAFRQRAQRRVQRRALADAEPERDDLARAVLNGKLVKGNKVDLRKGENDLVLKVIDHKKGWRFTCAFNQNGKPVKGLRFEAR